MVKRMTQKEKDLLDELYPIPIRTFTYQSINKEFKTIDESTEQTILNSNGLKIELIKNLLREKCIYSIHQRIPVTIFINCEPVEINSPLISNLMEEFELTEDEIIVILQYLYNKNLVTYYIPWNIVFWSTKK